MAKWYEISDTIPNLSSFMAFEVEDLFKAYRLERAKNARSELLISQLTQTLIKFSNGELEGSQGPFGGGWHKGQ